MSLIIYEMHAYIAIVCATQISQHMSSSQKSKVWNSDPAVLDHSRTFLNTFFSRDYCSGKDKRDVSCKSCENIYKRIYSFYFEQLPQQTWHDSHDANRIRIFLFGGTD